MSVSELDAVFRPKAVALVAPEDGPLAHAVARNLASTAGVLLRVGTGPGAVPALSDLASVPELCVIVASPERLPALAEEAGARGARAAVLISPHPADAHLCADLAGIATKHRIRLVGPASLGLAVPGRRLVAGAFHRPPQAGRVALVSQSGTLASAVADWAARRDVGFSHVVTLGEVADVGFADMLDYLAGQAECQAILLVLDGLTEARRFMSAARAAARLKPVIVLRTGRHGEAEATHDVTPDAIFDAAFRRAGLLRVRDLEELFDALETLAVATPIRGDRLAIVANGRGIGRLAADALLDGRLEGAGRLAQPAHDANPLDLGEGAAGPAFAAALKRLQADSGVDAVLLLHAPTALASAGDVAHAVAGAMPGARVGVLTSWLGERDAERAAGELALHHAPVFETPDRAVRAFLHIVRFRRNQELLTATPPSVSEDFVPDTATAARILADGAARAELTGGEAQALLASYGIAGAVDDDLTIRMREDSLFGPVLTVGPVAVLPPLDLKLARDALDRVPGLSAARREALTLPLVKLAQLVSDHAAITALTLGPGGAAVRLGGRCVPPAIRPYPKDLEYPFALPDGRAFLLRPVRPEDEPALKDLFHRLTVDEIRLRFFAPKAELSHTTAARMTQIDYDREMGLAVADPGVPGHAALHGVAHLSCDAAGERAEFAIMLAHDMAGLGLGPVLMRRLIDHARARGLREVYGEVLFENRGMLKLCEVLGFTRATTADDPGVAHVRLVF
ncbi:MAG TPA: GNAT family N-acetyltransferase [Azospirillum sp.]|nr:GNAT family N-acetyltransferase [Azospirillum sp.]